MNFTKADELAAGNQFFELVNKPFLEAAIKRGDDIALATIPAKKADYIDLLTGALKGNYAKELQYLVERNARPSNVTAEKWVEIRRWFK